MKLIGFQEIEHISLDPTLYLNWVIDLLTRKDETILPPKISIKPYDGVFCNVMPSFIPGDGVDYEGVKVVTRYPGRSPALDSKLLLVNAKTGEYLALMNADWITAIRTGAVAAHSIMLFAKTNYHVIGMLGLGNVSRATLFMLLELNKDKEFEIKLFRHNNSEVSFMERFKNYSNVRFSIVDDYYSVIKGSDVVVSGVTYAPVDFCPDEAFDEGVLVVPIHTLGFTNCDLFFDKVFADDTGHVCHFKNFSRFRHYAEVSDVINGKEEGRLNDNERILVYNIGISIHDINYAAHLYELVKNNPEIPEIDITGPTEKYWF